MKIHLQSRSVPVSRLGMTLVEVMVTSSIFGLAMAGFISLHLFGLHYNQAVKLKLSASNDARTVLNRLAQDVRSAGTVRIGNGDASGFTEIALGQPQRGNAIQVYPIKGDTNQFVRYYCDSQDQLLKRMENGAGEIILARAVTNALVFTSEDGLGNVLSNNFNNRVIGMTLQFYQSPSGSPSGAQGAQGFLYDYYQIRNKVTRRALE